MIAAWKLLFAEANKRNCTGLGNHIRSSVLARNCSVFTAQLYFIAWYEICQPGILCRFLSFFPRVLLLYSMKYK